MSVAKKLVIKNTKKVGRYRPMFNRPVVVEFNNRKDADYLLYNRKYLPEGVYIDREYSKETEEKRKELRPYLRAACRMPKYQRKCRLEGDALCSKGS